LRVFLIADELEAAGAAPPGDGMHAQGKKRSSKDQAPMTMRTTSKTVTFMHPFNLSGTDEVQPAGTYTVETDEELLEPSSFPAYRQISTLIRLPARSTGAVRIQIVETNPVELAAVLARDAQPDETVP
jgi:hypothetical protein